MKLTSIRDLLEYYSSFAEPINSQFEYITHMPFIPNNLITLSDCLINNKSHCNISGANPKIIAQWQYIRKTIENSIAINPNKKLADAQGLFYLVLEYGMTIFTKAKNANHEKEAQKLMYGPKQLVPIMSRISFSEMFDNMSESSQKHFIELINELCNYDFKTNRSLTQDPKRPDGNKCKKYKMPYYYTMTTSDKRET